MQYKKSLCILFTGILLLNINLANADTSNPVDSEMTEIIVDPVDYGYVWDNYSCDGYGDGKYESDWIFVGCRNNQTYQRMEKTVIKFTLPATPSGKKLVSARLRMYLHGKTSGMEDEGVILLHSNSDNETSISNSDYEDSTYSIIETDPKHEDDKIIVTSDKATGAWYEREVYNVVKNDIDDGHSSFRLELGDHTYRENDKIFIFSIAEGYSPQLVLSYARVPTVVDNNYSLKITVDPSTVLRDGQVDPLLTGWNNNYFSFQGAYDYLTDNTAAGFDITNLTVFPDVLEQLKSSPGNVYRYPGGYVSQYGVWTNTVGDVETRPDNARSATDSIKAYFGFNEFMKLVEDVHGIPLIVVNIGTGTAQQAADWVEYANAPSDGAITNPGGGIDWAEQRAADGHVEPYNIKYWEIGNETDSAFDFSPTDYIGKVSAFAEAMTSIDPNIKIIPHNKTYYRVPDSSGEFDIPVMDYLGSNWSNNVAGIAHHYYFEWGALGGDLYMELTALAGEMEWFIGNEKRIFITENATWGDANAGYGAEHTSGWGGAINLANYYNAISQFPVVKMGLIHNLGAADSWWPPFYYNSELGERCPTPIAVANQIVTMMIKGDALKTSIEGPDKRGRNNSALGDYNVDVSASAFQDSVEKRLLLTNHFSESYTAQITWPGLTQGDMTIEQVVLSRYIADTVVPVALDNTVTEYTKTSTVTVDSNGMFSLEIPKSSVVAVKLNAESNIIVNGDFSNTNSNWTNNSSDNYAPNYDVTTNTVDGNHVSGDATKLQVDQYSSSNSALGSSGYVGQHYDDSFLLTGTIRARGCDSGQGGKIIAHVNKNTGPWTAAVPTEVITDTGDWTRVGKVFSPVESINNGDSFHSLRISLKGTATSGGEVDFDEIALLRLNNLIENGDFEDSVYTSWGHWEATRTHVTEGGKVGNGYMQVSGTDGAWIYQGVEQNSTMVNFIKSKPHDQFRLRTFIKTSNLTGGGARIAAYVYEKPVEGGPASLAGIFLSDTVVTGTTNWEPVVLTFNPSEKLSADHQIDDVRIFLTVGPNDGQGYAGFDAVNLTHMGRDQE
jgi:alpha-L-arabinofuranosidase